MLLFTILTTTLLKSDVTLHTTHLVVSEVAAVQQWSGVSHLSHLRHQTPGGHMDLALVGVEDVVVPVVRRGEEGAVPGARESHVVVVTPVSEGQVPEYSA